MIPASFDYLRPATVAEALEMTRLDEATMFLAGGHALLPERKLRHTAPRTVIDLGRGRDDAPRASALCSRWAHRFVV